MYRLMTKGRQWLWVQPRLYLQYHQWSRKAESINVTHYVVTYQDVLTHLQKEKKNKERERAEMKVYDAAKGNLIWSLLTFVTSFAFSSPSTGRRQRRRERRQIRNQGHATAGNYD